ncbi:hypothetical protein [Nostoc sphaeroides]|nr:hypothetical protein [Nostoc sphaeroides]
MSKYNLDAFALLTPEELFSEITAEIKFYQQQISILQQQLVVLTGGFTNA